MQFFLPSAHTDVDSNTIDVILRRVRSTLSTDSSLSPFMLWTGEQLGISEIMVVRDAKEDGGQARCMGYATFCQRWRADEKFRSWLAPIAKGMERLANHPHKRQLERMAYVQRLLVDLAELLKPQDRNPDMNRCTLASPRCPLQAMHN
ncbi:hypothetical protein Moror_15992 [Moniliophthora roreri MCA 2997]|uniref:Uncharacterized protein n=1 Tax=Moniliophthora roreri (strain MCA 2997) TaxID=1381753 RepID=V2XG55_MONRO|nr:hypothetical protein Moror_15992 [Moniliophthora roreri MCA 2997]